MFSDTELPDRRFDSASRSGAVRASSSRHRGKALAPPGSSDATSSRTVRIWSFDPGLRLLGSVVSTNSG